MCVYKKLFNKICDLENLFLAWEEFKVGKTKKHDVADFENNLEQNIFQLRRDLINRAYKHDGYTDFYIHDPKKRHIYKATVRDRVLHHAIYNILSPVFEPSFMPHSFSCRIGKGNHKGIMAAEKMARKVSRNYTRPCFVLKCDVKKFFDTIDHSVLLEILKKKVKDTEVINILEELVSSYETGGCFRRERERERVKNLSLFDKKGVPIGNLTSQLFANVYMNEFDQFIKHKLKVEYYARYTDDFIIISENIKYLESLIEPINAFLNQRLKLSLHPEKVSILKYIRGIDFLGYVIFPHHKLIRKRTWKRILRNLKNKVGMYKNGLISKESLEQTLQSYLGILSHGNNYKLSEYLKNQYWFWLNN